MATRGASKDSITALGFQGRRERWTDSSKENCAILFFFFFFSLLPGRCSNGDSYGRPYAAWLIGDDDGTFPKRDGVGLLAAGKTPRGGLSRPFSSLWIKKKKKVSAGFEIGHL